MKEDQDREIDTISETETGGLDMKPQVCQILILKEDRKD